MEKVSIITATYNRLDYLKQAISSVLGQSYKDWEYFIVDDGSEDGTREYCEEIAKSDYRIHYLRQENQGVAVARNRALKAATGKYVAFLDDDDTWHVDKIAKQVAIMNNNPEVGIIHTAVAWKSGKALKKSKSERRALVNSFEDLLNWPCPLTTSSVLLRMECLSEEGFNETYEVCEDHELWVRIARKWAIHPMDEELTFYGDCDNRPQLSHDNIRNHGWAIKVYEDLSNKPEFVDYVELLKQHRARIRYLMGREFIDREEYYSAASSFLKAVATYPLVGLMLIKSRVNIAKRVIRVAKTYLAIPVCLVKGILR